jgi:(5-formylfuran-3-yl)methyl phosphate synthase
MTRLLVSVRSAAEARIAFDCGVDLIDVKEPNRGALGAADPSVWREVLDLVAGRVPVSCALGELGENTSASAAAIPIGVRYAKVGLAGAADQPDWESAWLESVERRPAGCEVVAVVYADATAANSPAPSQILAAAIEHSSAAILVDTYDKSAGDVFIHWPPAELAGFLSQAKAAGLLTVVGGGLMWKSLGIALELPADFVAVRGLACGAGRTSGLDAASCRQLTARVREIREISERR